MSANVLTTPETSEPPAGEITIEFLFLDLTSCTRCVGTDQNLESALDMVRDVLDATGAAVQLRKTLVETPAQAEELRFVSSPTIRINGRDLAFELKESACGCDACVDGCGEQIQCRDWTYRGQDYTQAPVGLIVDAILSEVYGGGERRASSPDAGYQLPDNLKSFYAGKASPTAQESCCGPAATTSDCCEPATTGGRGC